MTITQDTTIEGRIETNVFDNERLPSDWDSMSESEKMDWLDSAAPDEQHVDYNTTVFGMHEYFAINLDDTQVLDESVTHLAIGDDSTAPTTDDSTLTNEVFRKSVSDYSQINETLTASTFIDSDEANGFTFREVGLFAGPNETDRMWNHSTIAAIEKDNTRTITIEVDLTFSAA